MAGKVTVRKAHCAACGGHRYCDIQGEFLERYDDEDIWGRKTWYILQCRGCEAVFAQTVSINSEDYDQGYDRHGEEWMEYTESPSGKF